MRKRYIKEFSTVSDYNTFKTSTSYYSPNVSYIRNTDVILYNPTIIYQLIPLLKNVKNYLSFVAQANGTFLFSSAVDYSIDNGITWSTLASNTASPTVAAGSRIMWKATLTPTSSGIGTFSSTANFIVQGNVMSLLYGDNFSGQLSLTGKDYAFKDLFAGCTGITNAYKLSLPATTLSEGCYKNMFKNCTGMVIAPILLAVTLEDSCYSNMFYGCTSLVEAPELSAVTLTDNCYEYMFYGCSSLADIKCLATDITATNCTTNWVNGVANNGTFVKDSTMSSWTTGNDGIPTNWTIDTDLTDYSQLYLTFEVLEPGLFGIQQNMGGGNPAMYYSSDDGTTWSSIQADQYTETFSAGTKVIWKGTLYSNAYGVGRFNSSCNFNVSGNILSIVRGDDFSLYTTMPNVHSLFEHLFSSCKKLIRADKLCLPTNTSEYCYNYMFLGCTSLITPPQLPATTLEKSCYSNMFRNCTSLITAPELPATTLAQGCYYSLFNGCSSLTIPPSLPATTLVTLCYGYMFLGCTSLTVAPELPVGTIKIGQGNSELSYPYYSMFADCSNLHYIKCMARNTNSETAISIPSWTNNVSSTGTFVKAVNLAWSSGSDGIPEGWTVLEE